MKGVKGSFVIRFQFPYTNIHHVAAVWRQVISFQLKHECSLFVYFFSLIQALAALVNIYVAALNTPGTVPSVQSAWETFVHTKCSEAKLAALQVYESTMTSQLDGVLPCDSDEIRQVQQTAIEESMSLFQGETFGVSATSSEKYLDELTVRKHEESFLSLDILQIRI